MTIQEFQTWLSSEEENDEYKEMLLEVTEMSLGEVECISTKLLYWWIG
jgi:hypothetical protein